VIPVACNLIIRNEEKRIEPLLTYLGAHFEEIVIVDQESTDATVEIVEQYYKVISDKATGFANSSRQLAEDNTKSPWILMIDADEWPTDALIDFLPTVQDTDGWYFGLARVKAESYDIRDIFNFDLNREKYKYEYQWPICRLYKKGVIEWKSKLHHKVTPRHKSIMGTLDFTGIVEIKNSFEHERDEFRYDNVMAGTYNRDIHL